MKNEIVFFEEVKLSNGLPVLIEYSKNEEKGLVVAVAKETASLAIMSCERAMSGPVRLYIMSNSRLARDLIMNKAYAGVAYCFKGDENHPADKFDLEIGIEVAKTKVLDKLERAIYNRKTHLANYIIDLANMLSPI